MKKVYRHRAKKTTAITGHSVHVKYTIALPKRADLVANRLCLLKAVFRKLFSDENFLTLLQAESMTVPTYLKPLLEEEERLANEIL